MSYSNVTALKSDMSFFCVKTSRVPVEVKIISKAAQSLPYKCRPSDYRRCDLQALGPVETQCFEVSAFCIHTTMVIPVVERRDLAIN